MQSKISRYCEAVIEAGWLAALIIAPLFFNVFSSRVFEPDKLSLLRSIALVMAGAWLIKLVDGGGAAAPLPASATYTPQGSWWRRLRETPLIIPTLLLVGAYLLSTLLSVAPRTSWWGSYQRLQGTYTTLSYVVIFFLVISHLRRRDQLNRLLHAIVLTSLPIAMYGILQHYGLDPLPWGGDVQERVAGNMGNAIFIAAYLIIAFFITLERTLRSMGRLLAAPNGEVADALLVGSYVFVLVVQSIAIIFTQSRGPWLGWLAGIYIFVLVGLIALRGSTSAWAARWSGFARWAWVGWIGLALAGLLFVGVFNLPNSPLASLRDAPYIGRLGRVFETDEGTGKVRVLIWEGASQLILPHEPLTFPDGSQDWANVLRPFVGYGPEAMWVAFNRYYPPDLAHYEARNASPDRAHNETFDALVTTGIFGFLAYILLFGSIFYWILRWLGWIRNRRDTLLFLGLTLLGGAIGILVPLVALGDLRFLGVAIPAGLILGFIVYLTISAFRRDASLQVAQGQALLLIALLAAIAAYFVEIHFGIAIAATRTHFWVLTGVLLVTGLGWLDLKGTESVPAGVNAAPEAAPAPAPARSPAGKRKRRSTPAADTRPATRAPARAQSLFAPVLPYAFMATIVVCTLAWNFLANQGRDTNPFNIVWNGLAVKMQNGQPTTSLGIFWLLVFTLLVGTMLALGDVASGQRGSNRRWWLTSMGAYLGIALGVGFLFALIHAARIGLGMTLQSGTQVTVESLASYLVSYIYDYYLIAFALLLVLAWSLWRLWPARSAAWTGRGWITGLTAAVVSIGVALFINQVNIALVRADTYYKQGQAYDAAGQWDGAIYLYTRAIDIAPDEDYYYLFLGRSMLEKAKSVEDPAAQQEWLDQAEVVLTAAQRLNPLNTDHTANLARYYRSRGELASGVDERRQAWLNSLQLYGIATTLSPNAAHLYNESGLVSYLLGDLEKNQGNAQVADQYLDQAQAMYDKSLALDQIFAQTYLFLGDLYRTREQNEQAIATYRQATEVSPGLLQAWSALAYLYVQEDRLQEAIGANQRVTQLNPRDALAWRNLALLYERTNQLPEALEAAQRALELASNAEKPQLEAVVEQLQELQPK